MFVNVSGHLIIDIQCDTRVVYAWWMVSPVEDLHVHLHFMCKSVIEGEKGHQYIISIFMYLTLVGLLVRKGISI
jgi:hypothetical protein